MSWKTINAILGLATVDEDFYQALLKKPLDAIQARKFVLTAEEQEKIKGIVANDLAEFSQKVLILFKQQE